MNNTNNKQSHDSQLDLFSGQISTKDDAAAEVEDDMDEETGEADNKKAKYAVFENKQIRSQNTDFEELETTDGWLDLINTHFSKEEYSPLETARRALEIFPTDPDILAHAAFASLVENRPESCLMYIKRLYKRWEVGKSMFLCEAIALAQQNKFYQARLLINEYLEDNYSKSRYWECIPPGIKDKWINDWVVTILEHKPGRKKRVKKNNHRAGSAENRVKKNKNLDLDRIQYVNNKIPFRIDPLPPQNVKINISYKLPDFDDLKTFDKTIANSLNNFLLRLDFAHCALLKGFDELLCLPLLRNVDHYWYQIETARKVLKVFRGRVLLADEVGLGKTVEAGMILKEYVLRAMAERVLILTPPSLVGQWREEMESKFMIEFTTTSDPLLKNDPDAFWQSPRIIASIAVAKRSESFGKLADQNFDIIIVDEAHHLKNRNTKNWKLVDALKKRFLLLLSATPVQNNLVELYNLLTLLKPGIFKTEKDFKSIYMTSGNPRMPANKEELQNLMRDVMIRNTRSLVNVHLPVRNVLTIKVDPLPEELSCYKEIERLIRAEYSTNPETKRMTMRHILSAAGSSPLAASRSIGRFIESAGRDQWADLYLRYSDIQTTGKIEALFDIFKKNRPEKKIIFVRYRDTLELLDKVLSERGIIFTRFDGQMTPKQKDESIELFRFEPKVEVLLCTETGGEGRNIQFCNTMINFDLPWNPQAIEQRIGRIHRIGQMREVFVFNLTLKNSIEAHILRILDEKINMFELVVGEIQSILGEMDEEQDFSNIVFSTWLNSSEETLADDFDELGIKILKAKNQYDKAKALDEEIFGEEFEVV